MINSLGLSFVMGFNKEPIVTIYM